MSDNERLTKQLIRVLKKGGIEFDETDVKGKVLNVLKKYSVTKETGDNGIGFDDILNNFIVTKRIDGLSDKTLREYKRQLLAFDEYTHKAINKTNTEDIRKYITYLTDERNLKKTTLATSINILKTFFNWLTVEDIIKTNPCLKIKNLRIDKKGLRQSLTVEELEKLRNACKTIREKLIIEFLYSTGCRLSEAINIDVNRINFIERSIAVTGKGDKKRTVYFSTKTKLLLTDYLKERKANDDALFTNPRKPYTRIGGRAIEQMVKRLGEEAGIKKPVHPHLLRHTFATHALSAGMDIIYIQKLLGHSDIGTTQIYAEINQDNVKQAYGRLLIN